MRVCRGVAATLIWGASIAAAAAEPAPPPGAVAAPAVEATVAKPGGIIIPMPGTKLPASLLPATVASPSLKPVPAAGAPSTAAASSTSSEDRLGAAAVSETAGPTKQATLPAETAGEASSGFPTGTDTGTDPGSVSVTPETTPASDAATATDAATTAEAAAPAPPPEPTLVIDVNLSSQRLTVTENGVGKHTWLISSAALGYRTPTGTFKPSWMSRMWYSRQYDWSPMPHAIFFHNGVAIHATQAIRQLGRPASHGCVRLAPSNAAALYKLVNKHGKDMTRIVVHGSPRHSPTVASRGSYRYGQAGRRRAAAYAYYGGAPSYYVAAPKRRGAPAYAYQKPRRTVSRGLMQSPYGY